MNKNDYRVGPCDTCGQECENLTWGTEFPDRHCRDCHKNMSLCDECIEPCGSLIEVVSEWNPEVTNRYCLKCKMTRDSDDLARKAGMFISRSGKHESYMRKWWAKVRTDESKARMTPDRIEDIQADIARMFRTSGR